MICPESKNLNPSKITMYAKRFEKKSNESNKKNIILL